MIGEVFNYISEGFYQKKDDEVVQAFDSYERGLNEDNPTLQNEARRALESQLVSSGQMEEESAFINPDEFFPGGQRDQDRIDDFRRTMTMHHSGQQVLWTFAGTTGSMSVLTEKHLESMGRSLDDLKPAALVRSEKRKRSPQTGKNTTRLYLYGDGTASSEYSKEKAKVRFDRMQDSSGFNWNLNSYDPNYQVQKEGWTGAFDKEGDWVRLETESHGEEEGITTTPLTQKKEITLIHTLDGPLVYDAALLLASEEEEYYYSMDGELYGGVKNDPGETLKKLQTELKGTEPRALVLPEATPEETKQLYREKLGRDVMIYTEGSPEVKKIIEEDSGTRTELAAVSMSLAAVTRLQRRGLSRKAAVQALSRPGETVEVPLNPFNPEDRRELATDLSPKATSWLDTKAETLTEDELTTAIPYIAGALPLLAAAALTSGLEEDEVLEEALTASKQEEPSKATMTGRLTLGELASGSHPWKGTDPRPYDFFNEIELTEATSAAGLSEGEAASVKEAASQLYIPPVDRKVFNRMMSAALAEYRSIQMSTGMTAGDLVRSVDSISMSRPDGKRIASKQVHFEAPLHEVLTTAAASTSSSKSISREELFQPLSKTENIQAETAEDNEITLETALTMTEGLLAALETPSEGAAPLTEEQTTTVQALYKKSGLSPKEAQTATALWQKKSFTPAEFTALTGRLESKTAPQALTHQNPVKSEIIYSLPKKQQKSLAPFVDKAMAGNWESIPAKERVALSKAMLTTSGIALPVASEAVSGISESSITTDSVLITEDSLIVQAVADDFTEQAAVINPALTREAILPMVTGALAGDWSSVPNDLRQPLTRTVQRRGRVSSMVPKATATTAPKRSIKGQSRQLPVAVSPHILTGRGYSNLGYSVAPSRQSVHSISKEATGSSVRGVDFTPSNRQTPAKAPVVSSSAAVKATQSKKTAANQATSSPKSKPFQAPSRLQVVPRSGSTTHKPTPSRNVQAVMAETGGGHWNTNTLPHANRMSTPSYANFGGVPGLGRSPVIQAGNPQRFQQPSNSQTLPLRNSNSTSLNNQMNRMDRINANYEADKASMSQSLPSGERMLASSNSHSVGSAGGTGQSRYGNVIHKSVDDVIDAIKQDLQNDF